MSRGVSAAVAAHFDALAAARIAFEAARAAGACLAVARQAHRDVYSRELERQLETRDALAGIAVRVVAVTPVPDAPGASGTGVRFADWRKVHGGATLETAPIGGALTCGAGALDPDTVAALRVRFGSDPEAFEAALVRVSRLVCEGVASRLGQ